MRALVIGFGSIGVRHSKILSELGCEVRIVSKRKSNNYFCYDNFEKANLDYKPEYIVVSNSTDKHYDTYSKIKNTKYDGLILIEKPIFNVQKCEIYMKNCHLLTFPHIFSGGKNIPI